MSRLLRHLEDIVGEENVTDDEEVLWAYARDQNWPFVPPMRPDYVVRPQSREEVQAVMRLAYRERIPVIPYSAGINVRGLCIPTQGGIILDMRKMNRILEINTEMMACIIEPGVTIAQLASECLKYNVRPAVPGCPATASAVANYMLRGLYHHQWKDGIENVLSLEVVLPNGEVLYTGSWGFPNSPGPYSRYGQGPDLTGLFQNQPGTMGVVTKMCAKLYPYCELKDWVVAGYDDLNELVRVILEFGKYEIGTSCMGMHWLGFAMIFSGRAEDVFEFKGTWGEYVVTLAIEGTEETKGRMEWEKEMAEKIVKNSNYVAGGEIFPVPEDMVNEMTYPRDVASWFRLGSYYAVPFFAQISRAPIYHEETRKLWLKHGLDYDTCGWFIAPFDYCKHGQICYYEVETWFDPTKEEDRQKLINFTEEYHRKIIEMGAYAYFRPNPGNMSAALPLMGNYAKLWKAIKDLIDPHDIMNPGKVFV